jgi:hypothetical protein
MRSASESASVGTRSTLAEPVKIRRPGVRLRSTTNLYAKDKLKLAGSRLGEIVSWRSVRRTIYWQKEVKAKRRPDWVGVLRILLVAAQERRQIVTRLGWSSLHPVNEEAGATLLQGHNAASLALSAVARPRRPCFLFSPRWQPTKSRPTNPREWALSTWPHQEDRLSLI